MDRKKTLKTILILLVIFSAAGYIRALVMSLPPIHLLEDYTPSLVTKIYDYKGELITELFTERRTFIPLREIPVDLQNAVLAIEDDKFFKHWGISPRGILRASVNNLIKRRVSQGGSTITQQLAKQIFLTPERTINRKIKELLLTIQLERNFSKEEILQLYLNQIYLGSGAYGVESASKMYFGKHVKDLTLAECAMLAGLPRAPNYYSPFNNVDRTIQRRATVLRRMVQLKHITPEEEIKANTEPINSQKVAIPTAIAPYFIEYIRIQLEPKYGSDAIYRGGLSIYTTLDKKAQESAEKALEQTLEAFDTERKSYFEQKKTTFTKVQGSLVAIDPKTGGIRALVGGRDFRESQFNRALQARRQPGSSFKPFIYTAAIENGFTPASIIEDSPLIYINDGRDWRLTSRATDYLETLPPDWLKDPMKVWAPENYNKKYYGKVLLRSALEHSLNSCAILLLQDVGPMRAIDYARRMGIASPLTNTLSLALGSSDVTLMEMVSAMSVLASGGIRTQPYAVVRIEDKDGRILEENQPLEEAVLSPQTCFIMTHLLQGVVQRGTGMAALSLGRPCAGKTGTTNDFTDAWYLGYTPQLVAGVWVGYDDRLWLGNKMTGGRISCPIWTDFMKGALAGQPALNFTPPDGIIFSLIDPQTGLLALSKTPGAYLESFAKGTEPKDYYEQAVSTVKPISADEEEGF
ncbi:MAG: PBP1A family penicillin-binding protein [Elusimicrobiota bacterium]